MLTTTRHRRVEGEGGAVDRPTALRRGQHGATLTPKERQVVVLALQGRANKEIAAELGISLSAVKRRFSRLLRRHELRSRHELHWLMKQSVQALYAELASPGVGNSPD